MFSKNKTNGLNGIRTSTRRICADVHLALEPLSQQFDDGVRADAGGHVDGRVAVLRKHRPSRHRAER